MRKVRGYKEAQLLKCIVTYGDYEPTIEELVVAKVAIEKQINLFNRKFHNRYDSIRYEIGIDTLINELNFIENYLSSSIGYISFESIPD